MAVSSTFGQLLIVNGQPIIIKENDLSLNNAQDFGTDILQQAISGASGTGSVTPILDHRNNGLINTEHSLNVDEGSESSEYVTVLSNDHNSEEPSLIRLTLEQAAELGLHFTVDTVDQDLEPTTCSKELEDRPISPINNGSQYLLSTSVPTQQIDEINDKLSSGITCNDFAQDVNELEKNNGSDSYLNSLESIVSPENQQLSPQNQQFRIVPRIVNGTVTYSIENIGHGNNNEFLRLIDNNSSIITQNSENAENDLNLDLDNLTTSSDVPFITSSINVVSGKSVEQTANLTLNENSSVQTYGFVKESVAFLSLSDVIPAGKSISNLVTHINNVTTQQSKLTSNLNRPAELVTKQKVFTNLGGESLLLKQRNTSSHQHGQITKSKIKILEKSRHSTGFTKNSTVFSSDIIPVNETSDNELNVNQPLENNSSQEFLNNSEKNKTSDRCTSNNFVPLSLTEDSEFSTSPNPSLISKGSEKSVDGRKTPTVITPRKGDVPKEVSVAFSRIPVKTDNKKPLGSNENPITLVQQGSTFHSMQALTEDHISKIKPILHENFETKVPSKNVVYDPASNTRIIYRIISPAEVSLRKQHEFPKKRGRPRKVHSTDEQRQAEEGGEGAPPAKKMFPRTRSGRLSRPPKHMVRDYKRIPRAELDDATEGGYSDYKSDDDLTTHEVDPPPVDLLPGLAAKRKNHKRNISAGNLCPTCGKIYLGYVRMKRHFDKYPDHGSIEYLNTIRSHPDSETENHGLENGNGFWKKGPGKRKGKGRNCFTTADKRTRLKEALEWCEAGDVAAVAGPAVASVLSLWELLLLRVDAEQNDSRVAALYRELCQLAAKLRHVAGQLFRPLDHPLPPAAKHVTVQVEDDFMAGLLDLPSGVYLASDMDLEESIPPAPAQQSDPAPHHQITPSVPLIENKTEEKSNEDVKNKMEVDEEPQSFLLPNEEMICDSDDRVMVNVDEIVSERLQNFTGSQSSSVDELMKGFNELEQRNKLGTDDLMEGFSIVTRRPHVSASTEDLMKSLENFDSDLNHSDGQNTLDRDSFDRVSNVDTLDFDVLSREFHSTNR